VNRAPVLWLLLAAAFILPLTGSAQGANAVPARLALVGGRVIPAPGSQPIADGVVLIENGLIAAVGARGAVSVPSGATVIDCTGRTVTAGFWNSHVHFTGQAFSSAGNAPASQLNDALRTMLTSRGFVRVVDIGSMLSNTMALRRRIESGELAGPAVLTAGSGFTGPGGSPYYIRPLRIPEPATAAEAAALVNAELEGGADVVKLFTGSFAGPTTIVSMPLDVVRGATDAAHRRGKLVFAHPSDSQGARIAIDGGVDILAHTFPTELRGSWDRALPAWMRARGMAMIPTLKLYPYELGRAGLPPALVERIMANAQAQLRAFADGGGQVLFGTDVGYMSDYDTTDEFVYMQRAGLSADAILASLTTAPAARFGADKRTGRLAPGLDADIVVLDGDPAQDIRAFARVRTTLRGGRVIFAMP
jgi:imidazolonepropionase-like amidohydrolase